MRQIIIFFVILTFSLPCLLSNPPSGLAQSTPELKPLTTGSNKDGDSNIQIISPVDGDVIQGNVPVVVDTTSQGFQSVELTFMYPDDVTRTSFFIYQGVRPVTGTMLVQWDTTMVTDGTYDLQMVVHFEDGSQSITRVENLRVRNYTPVETLIPPTTIPTHTATPTSSGESVSITRSPVILPSSSPEPVLSASDNPASIETAEVFRSVGKGAALVFTLFLLGGFFMFTKKLLRVK